MGSVSVAAIGTRGPRGQNLTMKKTQRRWRALGGGGPRGQQCACPYPAAPLHSTAPRSLLGHYTGQVAHYSHVAQSHGHSLQLLSPSFMRHFNLALGYHPSFISLGFLLGLRQSYLTALNATCTLTMAQFAACCPLPGIPVALALGVTPACLPAGPRPAPLQLCSSRLRPWRPVHSARPF